MSTLYVDRRGVSLKLDGRALAFYENGERIGTVPLAPIRRVYLRGDVTLQSSLLGKLGESGVGVVILSGRLARPSLMLPAAHNDARRRVVQLHLACDHHFALQFSQTIIELKLAGQEQLLSQLRSRHLSNRYELTVRLRAVTEARATVSRQLSIAALRGLEGHAAAEYFAGLATVLPDSLGFKGRNRRPPRDPFNAVLSLGYTMLHGEAVLACHGVGLDPFVGFLHGLSYGRESLACDLVELLRPGYDGWLLARFADQTLRADDFSITSNGCLLGKAGRARFYQAFEVACEQWRHVLQTHLRELLEVMQASGALKFPQAREAVTEEDETFVSMESEDSDWPEEWNHSVSSIWPSVSGVKCE